jgi:pantoate kinase
MPPICKAPLLGPLPRLAHLSGPAAPGPVQFGMAPASPIAFSPGSVTCIFSPGVHVSPEKTYSKGFAINLSHGVSAAIQPAPTMRMRLNARSIEMPAVRHVLEALAPEPVALDFETPLPLGCGFGVSAGCALTAAFAIAERYHLQKSRMELGMLAHVGEVIHRSGFGDVASQLTGGLVYRRCRSGPLDSVALSIAPAPLYYRVFGELSTASILGSKSTLAVIAQEGQKALQWLEQNLESLTLDNVLARSFDFARDAGLLTDRQVLTAIQDVRTAGGSATMIMLGHSVLSTLPVSPQASWMCCNVDRDGTRWLP